FGEGEIELRQVIETPELTQNPETLALDAALRKQLERLKNL
ncbi:MAG: hypothetical protein K0Q73_6376, partial [Paenibacillus sp.]|nr:hypothetical protein [Paenibacillus sp.]